MTRQLSLLNQREAGMHNNSEYISLSFDELKENLYEIKKNKIPIWRRKNIVSPEIWT